MKQTSILFTLIFLIEPNVLFSQETFDQNTELTICFNATHTYVSDLGFYLIGPQECGSPIVSLAPPPQSLDPDNGCCCNSGNTVNNLCFSTDATSTLFVCSANTPLTGSFYAYYDSSGVNPIDWDPLYGCPINSGSWRAQIFDCVLQDIGVLNGATLVITGQTENYSDSVYTINSPINDNSCTHETASIVQFGTDPIITTSEEYTNGQADFSFSTEESLISFKGNASGNFNVAIYNIAGQVLFSKSMYGHHLPVPIIGGVTIISIADEKGEVVWSSKVVRP